MMNQINRQQLFQLIESASFAVNDISLFLDTHPDDPEALKAFSHYNELRNSAMRTYSENFGPLTMDTANLNNHWNWATDPWPWEGGCR